MYNETVLQHFQNPRNVGEIEHADGIGIYMSDFCGDITKFWIKVKDGMITNVKYRTQGCAASIACGSVLTELIKARARGIILGRVTPSWRRIFHDMVFQLRSSNNCFYNSLRNPRYQVAFDHLIKAWSLESVAMGNAGIESITDIMHLMASIHIRRCFLFVIFFIMGMNFCIIMSAYGLPFN